MTEPPTRCGAPCRARAGRAAHAVRRPLPRSGLAEPPTRCGAPCRARAGRAAHAVRRPLPRSGWPSRPRGAAPPAALGLAEPPPWDPTEKGALRLLRSVSYALNRALPFCGARCRPYPPFPESGVHSGESIHDAPFIRSATRDCTRAYGPARGSQARRSQHRGVAIAGVLAGRDAGPIPFNPNATGASPCLTAPRSVRSR